MTIEQGRKKYKTKHIKCAKEYRLLVPEALKGMRAINI